MMLRSLRWLVLVVLLAGWAAAYDPLRLPDGEARPPLDLDVDDAARDRTIPVRIFLPPRGDDAAHPVVLFSHGLGGARSGSGYLGEHWSRRGYVAVFLQHPGSDEAIWQEVPPAERPAALRAAASLENFRLRVGDVSAALDALDAWNTAEGHRLAGRLDLQHVGMSGHSFGAQTTQAVSGQSYPFLGQRFTEPRIRAAVVMSPGSPRGRLDVGNAFAKVSIPWLLLTGTRDMSPLGFQSVASRLAVFPGLPAGKAYELVLNDAEHSAFTERPLPGDAVARDPRHHRAILAVSTAFWDAYLSADGEARAWLDGDGPAEVLTLEDRWRRK